MPRFSDLDATINHLLIENTQCYGKQDIASRTRVTSFRIVLCYNRKCTVPWQAGHYVKDEGLQFQDRCGVIVFKTV